MNLMAGESDAGSATIEGTTLGRAHRIRAWASAHGFAVGERGRLPRAAVAAYEAAHAGQPGESRARASIVPPQPADPSEVRAMAASLPVSAYTWRALFPWLDALAPSELRTLQDLGGPAQWWQHETPAVTRQRRESLDPVFDLIAGFLEYGPLDSEPLSELLPNLPLDLPTSELDGAPEIRAAIQAAGGATLRGVAVLSPCEVMAIRALSRATAARAALTSLVRVGASVGLVQSAPPGPGQAVQRWFGRLDPRAQDLVVYRLGAATPISTEVLAGLYRTTHEQVLRLLEGLPTELAQAAAADPDLGRAVAVLEDAVQVPVARSSLIERHPWLATEVDGCGLSALDVLAAVILCASTGAPWLYRGSLAEAVAMTLEALAFEPAECMSAATADRLLSSVDLPLRPTQEWLEHCGLRVAGGQIECPASSATGSGPLTAQPEAPPEPVAPPVPVAAEPPSAVEALFEEVRLLALDEAPDATLAELLTDRADFSERLHGLLERLLHSRPTTEGWAVSEEPLAPGSDTVAQWEPDGTERVADALVAVLNATPAPLSPGQALAALLDAGALAEVSDVLAADPRVVVTVDGAWTSSTVHPALQESAVPATPPRGTLRDRAWAALHEAGSPLTFPLLVAAMGADVNERSLKAQLPTDPRLMRTDVNAWALAEWGLRRYTTIKDLVVQEVDAAGGQLPVNQLVEVLTREFSIKESSLLQVASSPPFTSRNGVVRRLGDPVLDEGTAPVGTPVRLERPEDGASTDDLLDMMGL
ncbi:hypothetical protein [Kitasatospora phosalacinea]|uniref:Lsr2 DNA-binding domain-containing protein n=1 Tax=Kitasatospora phosalacinea TaxID=2065 RepID=A0ABW6GFR9_9ACTN